MKKTNNIINESELKKIFSKRFKSLTGDMKQTELESITGIARQNLVKYLSGQRLPNSENLAVLAEIFNVSCDYLLGRDDRIIYGSDYMVKEIGLNKESLKILKEYSLNNNLELSSINQMILLVNKYNKFLHFFFKYVSEYKHSDITCHLMIKELKDIINKKKIKNK